MKQFSNYILEKLQISRHKEIVKPAYGIRYYLDGVSVELIDDIKNTFTHKNDTYKYFNVISDGDIIGILEQNIGAYIVLIVSEKSFENIFGKPYKDNGSDDYPDLPHRIESAIIEATKIENLPAGAGITVPSQFDKDKLDFNPDLYNEPEFQELLDYIKTTLE